MEIRLVYKIALAFLFLTASNTLKAKIKKENFTKTIEKSFDISNTALVQISNRYGKLDIKTWDKSSVDFKVTITVNAKSQEAADKDFERIHLTFNGSTDHVSAITEIGEKEKKSWWSSSSYSSDEFSIDYEVFLPATVQLDAANKYGHTYIEKMNNDLKMTQKYGDFQIAGASGDFEFSLGYGNGNIGFAENVNGYIKYSKLKIGTCKDIDLESKYSKMTIEEALNIKTISKYDGYTLGTIESFINEGKYDNIKIECVNKVEVLSKYTEVKIDHINATGDFDFSYGGVYIYNIDPGFQSIDLSGRYTSFKIELPSDASFNFDVEGDYSSIALPSNTNYSKQIENDEEWHHTGSIGNGNSNASIKAKMSYGGLRIKHN